MQGHLSVSGPRPLHHPAIAHRRSPHQQCGEFSAALHDGAGQSTQMCIVHAMLYHSAFRVKQRDSYMWITPAVSWKAAGLDPAFQGPHTFESICIAGNLPSGN